MSIRLHRMCRAAVSVALAVAASSFAGAKPPDLPTASREEVAPQAGSQEIEIIEEERKDQPIPVEQLTVMPVKANLAAARRMYLIGERCRRKGDLDMAANCYQETHLLCPGCSYGRKAIARLHEIEERRAADAVPAEAEEAEPPQKDNAPPDFDTSRRPLPPLPDGDVFRDLDSLLKQIADDETVKLLIEFGPGEEQEVPAATVPLPPKELTIHVDEPETYGDTSSLLRQAGDVLETLTGLDIDVECDSARSGAGLRTQVDLMLGAIGYKVTYTDDDGHATVEVVPSQP